MFVCQKDFIVQNFLTAFHFQCKIFQKSHFAFSKKSPKNNFETFTKSLCFLINDEISAIFISLIPMINLCIF